MFLKRTLTVGLIAAFCSACSPKPVEPESTTAVVSHRPDSVASGVAQLVKIRDSIKAAFDAGTPHECDGALHEASEILLVLPEVATDEGMSAEQLEIVTTNSKKMFDQFMEIHEGFHSHGTDSEPNAASYDNVAADVNAALEALAATVEAADG